MFWRFVSGAVRFRRRRLALAFAALTVAATLATALSTLYSDIDRKIRAEFEGYGANLMIAPAESGGTVPLMAVTRAEQAGAKASPILYAVGKIRGDAVVLAGIDFARARPFTQSWRVQGASAASSGECLAGESAAQHFNLRIGDAAALDSAPCLIRGIVSTGGSEDNQLLLPFEAVAQAAGVRDAASVIEIRAEPGKLAGLQSRLQGQFPDADVRLVRAVAETESNVVLKVRTAMFLLTALILIITTLCVTSNFSELVMERAKEIGILKAIGATERRIAALFLSESAILSLFSTAVGYLAGVLAAGWIAQSIFAGRFALRFTLPVLLLTGAVTLAVGATATLVAAGRIWRIEPAIILRGD